VGELIISLNDAGEVQSYKGIPYVMLADSFTRKNANGEWSRSRVRRETLSITR